MEYTYIVDCNEKLENWAKKDTSLGQDYTSVLIARGTWSLAKSVSGGTSEEPAAAIDLYKTGTKRITGAAGSKLEITLQDVSTFACAIKGLLRGSYPSFNDNVDPNYSIDNLDIEIKVSGASSGYAYGLFQCANLTNCKVVANTDASPVLFAISHCANLVNCFASCKTSNPLCYCIHCCINCTNCFASAISTSQASGSNGLAYAFQSCGNLANCKGHADTSNAASGSRAYGFKDVSHCVNCTSDTKGAGGFGWANSTYISCCSAKARGNEVATAFDYCLFISDTDANGESNNRQGRGFYKCGNLANINAHGNLEPFTDCWATVNLATY